MRRILAVFVALQAIAFSAFAQEPYLAASLGRSNWNMDCGPNGCERNTTSYRFAAGLRLNRVVAVEAFYVDLGRARSTDPSLDGELRGKAAGAEALVGWQFANVDLAGKIGFASVRADFRASPTSFDPSERQTHTELIGGAMLGYHLAPHLTLRLDLDLVTVALDSDRVFFSRGANLSTLLLGLQYQF
jgi:Outer membrane protein beta-barrel domain